MDSCSVLESSSRCSWAVPAVVGLDPCSAAAKACLGFATGIVVVVGIELGVCLVVGVLVLGACLAVAYLVVACLAVAGLDLACLAAVACLVLSRVVEYFACLVIRCID